MARRGRSKSSRTKSSRRRAYHPPASLPRLHRRYDFAPTPSFDTLYPSRPLRRPPVQRFVFPARVLTSPARRVASVPNRYIPKLSVPVPRITIRDLVCAKRAIRREVLFASGKGGSKVARPKFTSVSKIKC
ncbi:hypothetical protein [Apis mellifera associated microvirus 37]|nr:hypothetical protein [Apis mellifera associated microvirus 37]